MSWQFRFGHRRHLAFDLGSERQIRLLIPDVSDVDKAMGGRPFNDAFMFVEQGRMLPPSELQIAPIQTPSTWKPGAPATSAPAFYRGVFKWTEGLEAAFRPGSFGKGFVEINGFNIGRYWEIGPYPTYYIPGDVLKARNTLLVFDETGVGPDRMTAIEPVLPLLAEK